MDMSPYVSMGNNPVSGVDPLGDTVLIGNGTERIYYQNGLLYSRNKKTNSLELYAGSALDKNGNLTGFVKDGKDALDEIGTENAGRELLNSLESSDRYVKIYESSGGNMTTVLNIGWNPTEKNSGLDENGSTSGLGYIALAHELGHALDEIQGTLDRSPWYTSPADNSIVPKAEQYSTWWENRIRSEQGLPLRVNYEQSDNPASRLVFPGTKISTHNFKTYPLTNPATNRKFNFQIPFKYGKD